MPLLPPLHADREAHPRLAGDPFLPYLGLIVAAAAYLLDQATKQLAVETLVRGRMVEVLGPDLGWQLTYNPGGAFGFAAPSWFFLVVTVVVAVVVYRNLPLVRRIPQAVAFGLLLAGAAGNATDRILRPGGPGDPRFLFGHVVDFVAVDLPVVGAFPRFNLADVAIVSGLLLFVLATATEPRPHARPGRAAPEPA